MQSLPCATSSASVTSCPGACRKRRLPSGKLQTIPQKLRHLLSRLASHVEDHNGTVCENLPVVGIQPLRRNGFHLFRFPQPGNAEAVLPAHDPQQPARGVDPLVIPVGLNGGNEVFLFALHIFRQESSVLQQRFVQQFRKEIHCALQHPVPRQGKPVVQKAQVYARRL